MNSVMKATLKTNNHNIDTTRGVNPGGLGVATPRFWVGGRGVAENREVLLYFIMHRKYVQKW